MLEGIRELPTQIQNNKHNPLTATYYLLIKRFERNTDQNLVFGKFTRDKRLLNQSSLFGTQSSSVKAESNQSSVFQSKLSIPITSQSNPTIS